MKYRITRAEARQTLVIDGDIGDGLDGTFTQIVDEVSPEPLTIDCAGIGLFNSIGIRSWCTFSKRLSGQDRVEHERVPITMAALGLVVKAIFCGPVRSIKLDFKCAACGASGHVVVPSERLLAAGDLLEERCPACQGVLPEPPVPLDDLKTLVEPAG